MRAESVIYQLITADAAVAALVGSKVYPGRLPQNTVMPAVAYELIGSREILPIGAQVGGVLLKSRVQVSVLAKTYAEVKTIHEAIRKALLFQHGQIAGVSVISLTREFIGPDARDDALGLYTQGVDYLLVHDET